MVIKGVYNIRSSLKNYEVLEGIRVNSILGAILKLHVYKIVFTDYILGDGDHSVIMCSDGNYNLSLLGRKGEDHLLEESIDFRDLIDRISDYSNIHEGDYQSSVDLYNTFIIYESITPEELSKKCDYIWNPMTSSFLLYNTTAINSLLGGSLVSGMGSIIVRDSGRLRYYSGSHDSGIGLLRRVDVEL